MNDLMTPAQIVSEVVAARLGDLVTPFPLVRAARESEQLGHHVYLKREDLQPTFSFKIRGAYNRMTRLSAAERGRGVVCVSAGNHGQGVALAARHLGVDAVVVVPRTASPIKRRAIEHLQARVVLAGDCFAEAEEYCLRWTVASGRTLIHPFDDAMVIAGQGTIGLELLRDLPALDAVFVPVGGGGLIAGIGCVLKALAPHVRVVGVQPADGAAMAKSLAAGRRVSLARTGSFADGVAVRRVGALPFALARVVVDEIITVSVAEICEAIVAVHDETRSLLEPAGALGLAGLRQWAATHPELRGLRLAAVNSGANTTLEHLAPGIRTASAPAPGTSPGSRGISATP